MQQEKHCENLFNGKDREAQGEILRSICQWTSRTFQIRLIKLVYMMPVSLQGKDIFIES